MRAENFIAFFTVCGFFIGTVFTTIKMDDAFDILLYTMLVTFFFYLVIHIVIMNYVDVRRTMKRFFDKNHYEGVNDYLISELAIREKRMENLMIKVAAEAQKAEKTLGKRNGSVKAKAA